MFISSKRHILIIVWLLLFLFVVAAAECFFPKALPAFSRVSSQRHVFVIDAGHGGEDGGAVSPSGVRESDINLAISLKLNTIFSFLGRETVMVRFDDRSIYSDGSETLRQKKVSDLRNRVSLVNNTPNAVLISIHQNSLPSVPSVHGAQVFFGANAAGEVLATSVQSALNLSVNKDNEKLQKRIEPSIYLMKHITCPAILIECGFLSNAAESEKLCDPIYQRKLITVLASGILNADTEGKVS